MSKESQRYLITILPIVGGLVAAYVTTWAGDEQPQTGLKLGKDRSQHEPDQTLPGQPDYGRQPDYFEFEENWSLREEKGTEVDPIIKDLEWPVADFRLNDQPNGDLIRYLYEITRLVNDYRPTESQMEINRQREEFAQTVKAGLTNRGFVWDESDPRVTTGWLYLQRYYKSFSDNDEYDERTQCVVAQIVAGTSGLEGAPVPMDGHKGGAVAVAADLLQKAEGDYSGFGGTVVRFPGDKIDISRLQSGDSVFIRYGDRGHVEVVLATGVDAMGRQMVLWFGSNRSVDSAGKIRTDGMMHIRWGTQADAQNWLENEESQAVGLRPE